MVCGMKEWSITLYYRASGFAWYFIWGSGDLGSLRGIFYLGILPRTTQQGTARPRLPFEHLWTSLSCGLAIFHLVWDQKNRSTLLFENQKKKIISFRRCLACRNQDFCCHLPLLCTEHTSRFQIDQRNVFYLHISAYLGLVSGNAPMQCSRCKSRARVCKSTVARYFIWASGHAPRATGGCGSSSWLHMLHKVPCKRCSYLHPGSDIPVFGLKERNQLQWNKLSSLYFKQESRFLRIWWNFHFV